MESEDIYQRKRWYEPELKRLKKEKISEKNKKLILDFHKYLFSEGSSKPRVIKLSWQLRVLGKLLNKDFDKADEQDIRGVVAEINHGEITRANNVKKMISEETKADYRRVIKQFYKWLEGEGKRYPEKVEWIKCKVKVNGQKVKDLITIKEVKKLIEYSENDRDRAFLSFLYESGARIGEILNMRISDFQNMERWGKVRITGKTGPRTIIIVNSVPYINKFLSAHPFRKDSSQFLWISIGTYHHNERINYYGAKHLINRAFKRAGIKKKRIHLHLFRHSRATEMASHLTEAQMKKHFGWVQGSEMASVYVHLSGRDVENAMLSYYGLRDKKEEKDEKLEANIDCARCNTINPSEGKFCTNCGMALNLKVAMETEEQVKEETDKTLKLLMEMMKQPEIMKRFEEFKKNC